jgi:hypothetical protein
MCKRPSGPEVQKRLEFEENIFQVEKGKSSVVVSVESNTESCSMAGVVMEPGVLVGGLVTSNQLKGKNAVVVKAGGANIAGIKRGQPMEGINNTYKKRERKTGRRVGSEVKIALLFMVGKKRKLEPMEIQEDQTKEKRVKGNTVPQNSSMAGLSEQPCEQL